MSFLRNLILINCCLANWAGFEKDKFEPNDHLKKEIKKSHAEEIWAAIQKNVLRYLI